MTGPTIPFFVAAASERYKASVYFMRPFDQRAFTEIIDDVNKKVDLHFVGKGAQYTDFYKAELFPFGLSDIPTLSNENIIVMKEMLLDISTFAHDSRDSLRDLIDRRLRILDAKIRCVLLIIFYLMNHDDQEAIKKNLIDSIFKECPTMLSQRTASNDDELVVKLTEYVISRNEQIFNKDIDREVANLLVENGIDKVNPSIYSALVEKFREELSSLLCRKSVFDLIEFDAKNQEVVHINQGMLSEIITSHEFEILSRAIHDEVQNHFLDVQPLLHENMMSNMSLIIDEIAPSASSTLEVPDYSVHDAIQNWFATGIYQSELYLSFGKGEYFKKRLEGYLFVKDEEEKVQIMTPTQARFTFTEWKPSGYEPVGWVPRGYRLTGYRPVAIGKLEERGGKLSLSHFDFSHFDSSGRNGDFFP